MRRGVTFEVGERTFQVRFGTNALCMIEEQTGQSIGEAAKRLAVDPKQGGVRLSDLRLFWWAGLSHQGDLSAAAAGDLLDEVGFERAGELIGEAFQLAFPEAEGGAGAAGKKQKATAV